MASRSTILQMLKKRRERERDVKFASLVSTPHDFGTIAADNTSVTNLTMPARARLALSLDAAIDPSDITIVFAGTALGFSHPALAADIVHRGHVAEENVVVSVTREAGCPAGSFSLYQVDAQGLHKLIGTATFSA